MEYKIGDKVRIRNCEGSLRYNGKVGTVVLTGRIKSKDTCWDYLCRFDDMADYPFGLNEMEQFVAKGQQLEFAFMGE